MPRRRSRGTAAALELVLGKHDQERARTWCRSRAELVAKLEVDQAQGRGGDRAELVAELKRKQEARRRA